MIISIRDLFIFISPYIEGMSDNNPYVKFGEPTNTKSSMLNRLANKAKAKLFRKDRASQYAVLEPDLNQRLKTETVLETDLNQRLKTDFETELHKNIEYNGIARVIRDEVVFSRLLEEIGSKYGVENDDVKYFIRNLETLKGNWRIFTRDKISSWRMEKRVLFINIFILSVIESTIFQKSTIDNLRQINQKLIDLLEYFKEPYYTAILPINIFNNKSLSLIFNTLSEKLQEDISIREEEKDEEKLLTGDMRIILIELDNINETLDKDNFDQAFDKLLDDLDGLLLSKKIKLSDLKNILIQTDYDSKYTNHYLKELINKRVITPSDVRVVKNKEELKTFFKDRYLKKLLKDGIIIHKDLPKLLSKEELIELIPKLKLLPDSIELKSIVLNLEYDDLIDLQDAKMLSPVALKEIFENTDRLEKLKIEDYIELIEIGALQRGDVKQILQKTDRIYGLSTENYIMLINIGALQLGDVPTNKQRVVGMKMERELERESSSGGRKAKAKAKNAVKPSPVKKVVCGKLRCIYKIHGSRKEHLKYKGQLITVAEYKKIMKH